MPFIEEILKYRSLSIVGTEKNTGKTECLNYILRRLPESRRRSVCLTSIGIDGERVDQVTATQKPEILLPEGIFFLTSEKHYRARELVSELVEITGERSPLGRILLARTVVPGKVILSGPSSSPSLIRLMKSVVRHGVDLNIVDGALSRLSSASPSVSEAMILSTGAAYSVNLHRLIDRTAFIVRMMDLPRVCPEEGEKVTEISALGLTKLPVDDAAAYEVSGALTDKVLLQMIQDKSLIKKELRVKDFTRLFISPQVYDRFLHKGGRLKLEHKSRLLAVCVNPAAPNGYVMDSDRLCAEMSEAIGLPVYDIVKNSYET